MRDKLVLNNFDLLSWFEKNQRCWDWIQYAVGRSSSSHTIL